MEASYTAEVQEILKHPTATVEATAKVLGIGRSQAYRGVREGSIPSLRIGKRVLIPTRRLLEMLEGHPGDAA